MNSVQLGYTCGVGFSDMGRLTALGLLRRQQMERVRPVGARVLTLSAVQAAKRARLQLLGIVPLLVVILVVNHNRQDWFSAEAQAPVRYGVAVAVLLLGYLISRDFGRSALPWLFKRLDLATAGVVGFIIRLTLLLATGVGVFVVLGLDTRTLAVSGAVFAVVFGLAAQQTLGNVIAGGVIIASQPFRVGDRVRMQAGGLAGQLEGTVTAQGLLYTTFAQGEDSIMVPNNIVLSAAVVPLREPSGVDLRARLRPDVKPTDVQSMIDAYVHTEVRGETRVSLEEVDSDEVVVRITATPEHESDGARLADEVLAAIGSLAQEGQTDERLVARRDGTHSGPS